MKHLKKLDARGFAHWVIPALAIVVIGGIGTYLLTASHADTLPYLTVSNTGSGAAPQIKVKLGTSVSTGTNVNLINIPYTKSTPRWGVKFCGYANSMYGSSDIYYSPKHDGYHSPITKANYLAVKSYSPVTKELCFTQEVSVDRGNTYDLCKIYVPVQFKGVSINGTSVQACTLNSTQTYFYTY